MASLYDLISSAVIDGALPEGFSLPAGEEIVEGVSFADGALDGITIYHGNQRDDGLKRAAEAIAAANSHDFEAADALFLQVAKENQAICLADSIQAMVIDAKSELKAGNIYEYALWLIMQSENRECVKFGLILLELFDTDGNEELRQTVKTIGLSDEFALFSIFVMRHWHDGNDQIFDLAKRVRGWGRVHAVEFLEPATPEIKEWFLTEGVHNEVLPAYSALACWNKSGALQVLLSKPTYERFACVRDIVAGLLDEGPVKGISELPNRDFAMLHFLEVAEKMPLTGEDYEVIRAIREYFARTVAERGRVAFAARELLEKGGYGV